MRRRAAILTLGFVAAGLDACRVSVAEPTDANNSEAAIDSPSHDVARDSFADVPREGIADIPLPIDVVTGDAGESAATPSTIAMGGGFGCACDSGIVRCWGTLWNSTEVSLPTIVPGLSDAVGIAAGALHVCAVRRTGAVACWGENYNGQLGDGSYTGRAEPRDVTGIVDAVAVAAGEISTCALLSTGRVQCWGSNTRGQLGNGSTDSSAVPVDVSGVADAVALTFSGSRGCVIRSDRSLWCWGANDNSAVGDGTTVDRTTPTPVSLPDAVRVASTTRASTFAVLRDGATWCWGTGLCGDSDAHPHRTPVAVGMWSVSFLGVAEAGTLCFADAAGNPFCIGLNGGDVPFEIALPERPAAFATTSGSACAMSESGRAYCWGQNLLGEIGDGTRTSNGTPTLVAW